jgi:hypothetical protein
VPPAARWSAVGCRGFGAVACGQRNSDLLVFPTINYHHHQIPNSIDILQQYLTFPGHDRRGEETTLRRTLPPPPAIPGLGRSAREGRSGAGAEEEEEVRHSIAADVGGRGGDSHFHSFEIGGDL